MRRSDFTKLTNTDLVQRFIEAAKRRGLAVLDLDARNASSMVLYMHAIDSVLRSRGIEARKELLPLLDNKDRYVQYYAAKQLLGIAPDRAREIIESNHKHGFDAIAFDAGMTLFNLDTGVFKPD